MDTGFLNRLRSVQRLCGNAPGSPHALLFINGPDGKHNRGSHSMLKYLFFGAVGKELFDESSYDAIDSLDEMVLLVQASSVSVMWRSSVKAKLQRLLSKTPLLVEYATTKEEEEDEDAYQTRKCTDFKRMMLEATGGADNGGAGGGGAGNVVVGVPVPLGYSDVYDIENWPLLQAFAMEAVYPQGGPLGYFTSRYTVVDVTEHLAVLFQSVDSHVVQRAVGVMTRTVLPHSKQFLEQLDGMLVEGVGGGGGSKGVKGGASKGAADYRGNVTAEDLMSSLELLFEFGELHTQFPVDPSLRPVLLLGKDTKYIGGGGGGGSAVAGESKEAEAELDSYGYPRHWQDARVGASAVHCVVEACEPSTGVRWCRTYMLQRGKLAYKIHLDSLVAAATSAGNVGEGGEEGVDGGEGKDGDEAAIDEEGEITVLMGQSSLTGGGGGKGGKSSASAAISAVVEQGLRRIELLYVKLHLALRHAVRVAFTAHSDVLEAAGTIQSMLDNIMKSTEAFNVAGSGSGGLEKVFLRKGEVLAVHMDCLNQHGQLLTIDDINDIAGSCWVYIRVAVHGIGLKTVTSASSAITVVPLGSVAVGDTFLFSACSSRRRLQDVAGYGVAMGGAEGSTAAATAPYFHFGDAYCVTHAIPYYRCMYGGGAEQESVRHFQACLRIPRISAALGMGKRLSDQVTTSGSGMSGAGSNQRHLKPLVLPMLTDNPVVPFAMATCTLYESGLIIDKLDECHCLPIVISFALHVDRAWVVQVDDCIDAAVRHYRLLTAAQEGQASTSANANATAALLDHLYDLPADGVLVVFRLRSFGASAPSGTPSSTPSKTAKKATAAPAADSEEVSELISSLQGMFLDSENDEFRANYIRQQAQHGSGAGAGTAGGNPLATALPNFPTASNTESKCLALLFSSGGEGGAGGSLSMTPGNAFSGSSTSGGAVSAFGASSSASHVTGTTSVTISNILALWKHHLGSCNIPIYKGVGEVTLPDGVLTALLKALDMSRYFVAGAVGGLEGSEGASGDVDRGAAEDDSDAVVAQGPGNANKKQRVNKTTQQAPQKQLQQEHSAASLSPTTMTAAIVANACVSHRRQVPGLGYSLLRSHQLLASSYRLSNAREMLGTANATDEAPSAPTAGTGDHNTILVHGMSGVGVVLIATQLSERITLLLKEEMGAITAPSVEVVCVDVAQLLNQVSEGEHCSLEKLADVLVREHAQRMKKPKNASAGKCITILCVVNTANCSPRVEFDALVNLLCLTRGLRVSFSVAVVAPLMLQAGMGPHVSTKAVESRNATPVKASKGTSSAASASAATAAKVAHEEAEAMSAGGAGVGREVLPAVILEMCKPTVCSAVVAVSTSSQSAASTAAYSAFRAWLEASNSSALLFKVAPTNLWLPEECVQVAFHGLSVVRHALHSSSTNRGSNTSATDNEFASTALHLQTVRDHIRIVQGLPSAAALDAAVGAGGVQALVDRVLVHGKRYSFHRRSVPVLATTAAPAGAGAGAGAGSLKFSKCVAFHPSEGKGKGKGRSQQPTWDVVSLLSVLKSVFPQAAVSNTVATDVWNPNCLGAKGKSMDKGNGNGVLARLRLLASIKVMAKRQVEHTRRQLDGVLSKAAVAVVGAGAHNQGSVSSIHGIVRVKVGGGSLSDDGSGAGTPTTSASKLTSIGDDPSVAFALVEANAGFIVIRPLTVQVQQLMVEACHNVLFVQGCMCTEYGAVIKDLLDHCLLRPLPMRPILGDHELGLLTTACKNFNGYGGTDSSLLNVQQPSAAGGAPVSPVTLMDPLKIQAKYGSLVPLPSGCWFDGEYYVDFYGSRVALRPDMSPKVLQEYLDRENAEARRYNNLLQEVQEYLL